MGNMGWGARLRAASALVPFALAGVACAEGDGSDDMVANTSSTLASCRDERHVVAFDYFGTVTLSDDDLGNWVNEGAVPPPPRPGIADVANAYRSQGYEILYLTTAPAEIQIGDRPVRDGITDWLVQNGLPMGDGATLWVWDGTHTPMRGVSTEFDRLVGEGATIDAAYTDNEDKAFAFKSAVPSDQIFTLGTAATTTGSTPVPGDDMVAHAAEVETHEAVCRPAP